MNLKKILVSLAPLALFYLSVLTQAELWREKL